MAHEISRCNLHEQALNDIMSKLTAAVAHQAATTEAINSLRHELAETKAGMYLRQDATNGRVTLLERDRGKMGAEISAMEALTPNLLKALDELAAKKASDHERIWHAIEKLKASDDADHQRVARDEGWRSGAAKIGTAAWAAIVTVCGLILWIIERVIEASRIAPTAPK